MKHEPFLARLRRDRLAAIVRGRDAGAALRTVLALAEEGVGLVEVSLTTADACRVIAEVRREVGDDALIGAGTVVTADDLARARDAGASWIVTPALGTGVTAAVEAELPVLAGALTPTECVAAMAAGATAVKLFPAGPAGGPAYLRALRDPFPELPVVPVGGVDAAAAEQYLAAGALAVGVGGPLVGDAAHGGDLTRLRARARAFTAALAGAGGAS
ncbi:bifunctional 4-hydroxy-2-oxoglutarate aldolase/2-dehydro-3-deoxy-phosphogluconate aldolase [Streptomyces sp. DSM 44915]|uniref:Bifunctional 4-hydroxy-2-oxoglutarate aldolase/2-dehydro-3-deoxy-phosphogluconate aldolase n=1 Tax=Streptomyces chisholmiae TaxID=3075540 RepID=A0ABU2K0C3_9ACTN|nr:bifunctional 4-hydroxy-2-oxoglutarate aldolase/2-dehydro-3-deoxy-phosphogluconate aldolase [Streptomyces sp. DSM 44915]MDT0270229.1 bifunctional 4-hydroxy-2-oxoglutarate aldolase/2-dehydro-3-deoxy-phosphogluconate aldolase [Streptomyces sp. DSM 44915]